METFKDIINGDKPVLVDFFATWCSPCKAMSPIIESIGKELQGKMRILKVDVDKNQEISAQFQVKAIPTLMIFKDGDVVWRNAGAMDKSSLIQQLKEFID